MKTKLLLITNILIIGSCFGYSPYSPYSYCAGNPIKYMDPTGEDIVILNHADGMHLAMLIQNEEGKWQYYSINGDNVYISGKHSGGRTFNDIAVGSWDSPIDFMNSDYNVRDDKSKDNKSKNHFGYTEGYQIHTSAKQDKIMRTCFKEKAQTDYDILTNNCATIVQEVLIKASIPVAEPSCETVSTLTSFGLVNRAEAVLLNSKTTMIPGTAFKSIMRWNPGGIYLHK